MSELLMLLPQFTASHRMAPQNRSPEEADLAVGWEVDEGALAHEVRDGRAERNVVFVLRVDARQKLMAEQRRGQRGGYVRMPPAAHNAPRAHPKV